MNGVLNLYKPSSWTSHDVVAKVRGILQEKQIGHLGTLDPLATGVLPLALGAATRLLEFTAFDKEYVTTCLLGKTTDSCDITGKNLRDAPVEGLADEKIRQEILKMRELTQQIPPMVSAVKKDGQKLYELARKGLTVEREPRPIRIGEVEVLQIELPRVVFRVVGSAGTYVRVLCHDLGETLGVGGCMEKLERTRVGPFFLKDSVTMEDLKKRMEESSISGMLLPSSLLVSHLPEVRLEESLLVSFCQGKAVKTSRALSGPVRVLSPQGRLCAMGEGLEDQLLKPRKVFGVEGIL
jgi:tRNA pseudouridine55 synthase